MGFTNRIIMCIALGNLEDNAKAQHRSKVVSISRISIFNNPLLLGVLATAGLLVYHKKHKHNLDKKP
jgi:hypothetical protein